MKKEALKVTKCVINVSKCNKVVFPYKIPLHFNYGNEYVCKLWSVSIDWIYITLYRHDSTILKIIKKIEMQAFLK
jgi:hypothetical protein